MSQCLFVYGSLLKESVQQQVLGRFEEGIPDALEAHKTIPAFVDGQQYLTAIPDKKSSVAGRILMVSEDELAKIDMYEEPEYTRRKITLKSGTEAWLYTYRPMKSEGAWV